VHCFGVWPVLLVASRRQQFGAAGEQAGEYQRDRYREDARGFIASRPREGIRDHLRVSLAKEIDGASLAPGGRAQLLGDMTLKTAADLREDYSASGRSAGAVFKN
jgi:hypothetical protein